MRKRRALTIAAGVSFVLLTGFLVASTLGFDPASYTAGVRIWGEVRVVAWGGNFSVFNAAEPYVGGIVELRMEGKPSRIVDWKYLTWPGITYDYFRYREGYALWSLTVSKAYPIALTAILPGIWMSLRIWDRRKARRAKTPSADAAKGTPG